MSAVDNLFIGYAPYSSDFSSSGDRRRFVYYANSKGIDFEIAKPENEYDIVFVTHGADITVWSKYDKSKAVIVYELIDSYLAWPVFSFYGLFRGLAKYLSGTYKYCELKKICPSLDSIDIGGGFPIKTSLTFEYDYEYQKLSRNPNH